MPLNYETIFEDLGVFLKAANQLRDTATGSGTPTPHIPNLLDSINSTLNSNSTDHILDGVNTLFSSVSDTMSGFAAEVAQKCDQRLLDRLTVLNELLTSDSGSLSTVLRELIRAMNRDGQAVLQSMVSLGTPSPLAGNVGNGTVLVTKVLDGYSSPGSGLPAHLQYKGLNSELAVPSETVTLTCTSDSSSQSVAEGQETFLLEGQLPLDGSWDWKSEGSGERRTVPTDNAYQIMANRDLEAFGTDGTPVSWEATTGLAGTDFVPDYVDANVYRGNAAMKFPAAGGDVVLEQTLSNSLINANRQYRLSWAWKVTGATTGTIQLEVYSASQPSLFSAGQKVTQTFSGATSTNWALQSVLLTMPASLPDDLVFRLSSTTVDGDVWIDSMAFAPVTYSGGLGYNILAGSTSFSVDDRFTVINSNQEAVFQKFFRRVYGVQLPSATSGSETIPDSYAT